MLNVIYSDNDFDDSIFSVDRHSVFLAGPTRRSLEVQSWRPEAVQILNSLRYEGDVFYPEAETNQIIDYATQVEWEYRALEGCKTILFWVPRDLIVLPAFTTNVEFGRYVDSGRAIYGRPDSSPNNRYLDWLYKKVTGFNPENNLTDLIKLAVARNS